MVRARAPLSTSRFIAFLRGSDAAREPRCCSRGAMRNSIDCSASLLVFAREHPTARNHRKGDRKAISATASKHTSRAATHGMPRRTLNPTKIPGAKFKLFS